MGLNVDRTDFGNIMTFIAHGLMSQASLFAANSGATFSPCGEYRYHLWRVWDDERPIMCWIMMNPSTADEIDNDPTIRRCIGFAKREHCGGVSIRNVFALRSTDPAALLTHPDPFGPENAEHLNAVRNVSLLTILVAAWGNQVGPKKRSPHRTAYCHAANACMQNGAYCLGTTKSGQPKHPLYLASDTPLVKWEAPSY